VKIGVFDSGSGGLTVLRELEKTLPGNEYVYFGDFLRVPYGDKPREKIVQYSTEIARFLEDQGVEMIVVACNTVVANAMDELKAMCNVPVVGVIDPTIEYVAKQGYSNVGVAATAATVNSEVYKKGLAGHGIDSTSVACSDFVSLIEANKLEKELDISIERYFGNFVGKDIQAVVLGCTHYPIIREKLQNYLNKKGEKIELVDPAIHTVNHIAEITSEDEKQSESVKKTKFWFGKVDESLLKRASEIMGKTVDASRHSFEMDGTIK